MEAWIKIAVVLIMLSMLSWVVGVVFYSPFMGLILMAVILTLIVAVVEPATAKAMAQVTVPLVLVLFAFQVIIQPGLIFDIPTLVVIGFVLYLMFALFTGGGSGVEGGIIDPGLSCKLFPVYAALIVVATFADTNPGTYRLPLLTMVGTIFALMVVYAIFLRNYDKWPLYEYGKSREIVAITDIDPKGKVKSGAEIWWAKTTGPPIREGERVYAVAMSGLTLVVSKEEPRRTPPETTN